MKVPVLIMRNPQQRDEIRNGGTYFGNVNLFLFFHNPYRLHLLLRHGILSRPRIVTLPPAGCCSHSPDFVMCYETLVVACPKRRKLAQ